MTGVIALLALLSLSFSFLLIAFLQSMRKMRSWYRMLCAVIFLWKVSELSRSLSSCCSWLLVSGVTWTACLICRQVTASTQQSHQLPVIIVQASKVSITHWLVSLCPQEEWPGLHMHAAAQTYLSCDPLFQELTILSESRGNSALWLLFLHILQERCVDREALEQPVEESLLVEDRKSLLMLRWTTADSFFF